MSIVEIKVMDLPEVKQFCDETEKAIAELTARAEKAEHERDAQHELVLKLTTERDAAHAAAAAWEVQAQDFRDKLVAEEENNRKAICTYCGHVGQKEDVPAHIDECLKHPLSWKNDPQGYALEMLALRRQVAELRGS